MGQEISVLVPKFRHSFDLGVGVLFPEIFKRPQFEHQDLAGGLNSQNEKRICRDFVKSAQLH